MKSNTKKYVFTGLMTALIFVLTFLVKIPIPYTSGYIHLGDSMIYLSVMVLGPVFGAFASGVGSMLADLAGGYVQYAIPTLAIKSLMAFVMGLVISAKTRRSFIASIVSALSVWVVFCTGTLLYMKKQIEMFGEENIISAVVDPADGIEAVEKVSKVINKLPYYFTIAVAILIVIFAVAAYIISKRSNKAMTISSIVGMSAAGLCMVMGYFIVECFMYSPIAAIFSIPPNMIQFFGGMTAAGLLAPAFLRVRQFYLN